MIAHPKQKEVFLLDFEPILNEYGAQKDDCERTTAKRLCAALHQRYPDLKIIMVEDALYANAPHIRQITGYDWSYVLNVKPDSHKSMEKQFAWRRVSGQVKKRRLTDERSLQHYFAWTNDLCLSGSAIDIQERIGTKANLWASRRKLFNVLVFNSMEALYIHMTSLYRLQIE